MRVWACKGPHFFMITAQSCQEIKLAKREENQGAPSRGTAGRTRGNAPRSREHARDYVQRTEAFLEPLQEEMNFELVDVEFVKEAGTWYLRVYCDMEGGIGVDDCADISRRISDWLDQEDFISESYILEVSSPGLGRPLKKDKDFLRETGKEVEARLFRAVDGQKDFSGTLKAFDSDTVTLLCGEEETVLERKNIAIIRLALDF